MMRFRRWGWPVAWAVVALVSGGCGMQVGALAGAYADTAELSESPALGYGGHLAALLMPEAEGEGGQAARGPVRSAGRRGRRVA